MALNVNEDSDNATLPPRRRRTRITTAILLVLTLLTGAGMLAYRHLNVQIQSGPVTGLVGENIAVLDTRLENMDHTLALHEKRLKAIEDAMEEEAPATAELQSSAAPQEVPPEASDKSVAVVDVETVARDEEARTQLEAAHARFEALEQKLMQISAQVSAQRSYTAEESLRAIRLITAWQRFKDKVVAGAAFAKEMAVLKDSGADEGTARAIAAIAAYADTGAPNLALLLAGFDQAVEQLLVAEEIPPAEAGAWQRFKHNVSHLVRVRKLTAKQDQQTVDAILARAQEKLEKDEVKKALDEIQTLPEKERAVFNEWQEDAQAYLLLPAVMEKLEARMLERAFDTHAPAVEKKP